MENEQVLQKLEEIRKEVALQNSYAWLIGRGVIYGVAFFLGSAIIAVILLGLLGPWFAQIEWVRNAFETGGQLLGK